MSSNIRPSQTAPRPGLPEGIEEMRMIGRVAYLRFTAFPHDPRTAPAARAFLLANAGAAKAVVIDARALPGGGIEVMDALLPLFFSRRTVLLSLETRAAGDKDSPFPDGATLVRRKGRPGYVTRDHIVRPDTGEKRLRNAPLYYLTSGKTASAGEHLALALKRTRRATLIGEKTRGAGHYVALAPVGSRLTALVPVGRAFDPATGWDWEGKGVTPDVAVPADAALDEALRRIG
jgi:C-terminal processing protease CtpA/Prc